MNRINLFKASFILSEWVNNVDVFFSHEIQNEKKINQFLVDYVTLFRCGSVSNIFCRFWLDVKQCIGSFEFPWIELFVWIIGNRTLIKTSLHKCIGGSEELPFRKVRLSPTRKHQQKNQHAICKNAETFLDDSFSALRFLSICLHLCLSLSLARCVYVRFVFFIVILTVCSLVSRWRYVSLFWMFFWPLLMDISYVRSFAFFFNRSFDANATASSDND